MIASFALLWAWILARNAAKMQRVPLWPGWTIVQIAALLILVLIFARRMMRVRVAMRALDPRDRRDKTPQFPEQNQNGHSHK